MYFGTWDIRHDAKHGKPGRGIIKSHFCATSDGQHWTEPQAVYQEGCWLWRVEKLGDAYYSAGYEMPFPGIVPKYQMKLLHSPDGVDWKLVSLISDQRNPDEAALFRQPDGHMLVVTRMQDERNEAFLFESDPPYALWTGTCLGTVIHSPAIAEVGGRLVIAGRSREAFTVREDGQRECACRTSLWQLEGHTVTELLTLPSGGDTAYPGLLADGGDAVLISWYSMHDQQSEPNWNAHTASIYLARVAL